MTFSLSSPHSILARQSATGLATRNTKQARRPRDRRGALTVAALPGTASARGRLGDHSRGRRLVDLSVENLRNLKQIPARRATVILGLIPWRALRRAIPGVASV